MKLSRSAAFQLAFFAWSAFAPGLTSVITNFAGNGTPGFSGDGAQATSAQLNSPISMAMDTNGNLFIVDAANHRIRKVTPAGTISTIAGNGVTSDPHICPEGGPATSCALYYPEGVAVDAAGNVFVSDTYNNQIRKVTGGVITTVAGNGIPGFSGDDQLAVAAQLYYPRDLAFDGAGNLFIADTYNNRIRKVTPNGYITTIAGVGLYGFGGDGPATAAYLAQPFDVAVALQSGDLLIADPYNNRIRKVTPGGTISTIAGTGAAGSSGDGGPATSAKLNYCVSVAVDSAGNIFIADFNNQRVRMVTPGGTIDTVTADLVSPFGLAMGAPATSSLPPSTKASKSPGLL